MTLYSIQDCLTGGKWNICETSNSVTTALGIMFNRESAATMAELLNDQERKLSQMASALEDS